MSPVSKNSTELAFWCVQKLSGTHIPCPVNYLSFQNQTSSQGQKVIHQMGIIFYELLITSFYSVKCAKIKFLVCLKFLVSLTTFFFFFFFLSMGAHSTSPGLRGGYVRLVANVSWSSFGCGGVPKARLG